MANLYEEIDRLKENRKKEYDHYKVLESRLAYFDMSLEPDPYMYEQYEDKLKAISKKYCVDCDKLAKILSKEKGEEYSLKVFKEIELYNGIDYYTHNYMVCYVNKNNRYFDTYCDHEKGICLYQDDYKVMIDSLNEDNSILVSTRENNRIFPVDPCEYITKINFMDLVTGRATAGLDILDQRFGKIVKSILKEKVKQIEVGKEELNNLGV